MPSKSKAQQKFMGMVHALKKGEMDPKDASPELKKAAQSMSDKDAKDFASTPHKGLPRKVKQEILNKLKEYASKMGTNTLGGDDYTTSRKGGLRDFDGYDNVDYNKDMPMDEGMFSAIDHIRQNSKNVRDFIKNVLSDKQFRDMKSDKDFIKYLGSIYEGKLPNNWMQGRTSDYHTSLRGKKRDYDDTNFKKDNSGQTDLEEATKPDFNSKGYKDASKLVAKLRSSSFRKYNDDELEQFRMVIAQAFDLRESVNESGYSLEDLIGQVKTFNKPKTQKLLTIYVINKLKEKRNNSKSKSNQIKIQKLIDKIEGDYKKGKYLTEAPFHAMMATKAAQKAMEKRKLKNPKTGKEVSVTTALKDKDHPNHNQAKSLFQRLKSKLIGEYGQRLDLSYLEDEEARLDGTPEPKDAIDRELDEGTMIRRAVDLAQEILPKDTWSRYASDGKKNAEFVKSIVRDLTQLLNKFYKSHNVSVRIKEEVLNEIGLWRIDHYTNSKKGLVPNSFATVRNDKDREKKRAVEKDLAQTLNGFWKRWSIPYRIDLSKKQR